MNSSPRPNLKVTLLHLTQRGISNTSSCSTLTTSTGPMPSGKSKTRHSEKGSVVPTSVRLPHHRRVQAFLDHCPDGERGSEVVARNHHVRGVPNPEFVDVREQVVGGIAGEHVGQSRLHPDAHQCSNPSASPPGGQLRTGGRPASPSTSE